MSGNWIFQAQPKRFQIDKFLEKKPNSTSWLASQHASRIAVGDRVFLWRSIGSGLREESGIFAEAHVTASATLLPSPTEEQEFWTDVADRDALALRVRIAFDRIGDKASLLRRRFLEDDPVLGDLSIFDKPIGTNYPISTEQADRIAVLWFNAKWDRDTLIGALWLAMLRREQPSQAERSPLDEFSIRAGRSIADVKSKVETFLRMNPKFVGRRQEYGNSLESEVWDEFFDPVYCSINLQSLDEAYRTRWGMGHMPTMMPDGGIAFPAAGGPVPEEPTAKTDLLDCDLNELHRMYAALETGSSGPEPLVETKKTEREDANVKRSRIVVAIAKVRAGFRCEVPNCSNTLFVGMDSRPYIEVHHIQPLSEGGPDIPENVAAVCPAHHREAHHGVRAPDIKMELQRLKETWP